MEPLQMSLALLAATASFTLSAAAGMGGSLILVPAMALLFGTKEGIALAALLLACNNVFKVIAYRATIPLKAAAGVVVLNVLGAAVGARLLIHAPESIVSAAVVVSIAFTLIWERVQITAPRQISTPVLAFGAGATSGFSGTSGPLKSLALRNLELDRFHLVGAASVVSLAGDVTKTFVYAEAQLLQVDSLVLVLAAMPLMVIATWTGRRLNRRIGETGYAILFWAVMIGYSARLILR